MPKYNIGLDNDDGNTFNDTTKNIQIDTALNQPSEEETTGAKLF